jgi:hypothetical protein
MANTLKYLMEGTTAHETAEQGRKGKTVLIQSKRHIRVTYLRQAVSLTP